jgi:FkbM family methyltransferase
MAPEPVAAAGHPFSSANEALDRLASRPVTRRVERLLRQLSFLPGLVRYIVDNPSNEGEKLYRLGLALGWQIYKRTVGLPLVVTLENGLSFVADPISLNSTGVIYTRLYEPEYTQFVREHVVPGGAIIDVGAHVGLFTLQLADLFREGACFEPAADNFRLLERNLRINDLAAVRAVKLAVSDHEGELDLLVTASHSPMNRLDRASAVAVERTERVGITTLDGYLAAAPLAAEIRFIKLDIEGHELPALRGARRTIEGARAALAIIENSGAAAICQVLEGLGWAVFAITKRGEVRRDRDALERAYNLVACGPDHPLFARVRR